MKLLDITIPPVYGFLHHAYPLSILSNSDHYLPWFFSNYTQLYTYYHDITKSLSDYKIDFYSYDGKYQRFPNLPERWLDRSLFEQNNISIIDFIINSIDENKYIEIYLDEYFLPFKGAYKKYKFIHQNLIYGYDLNNKIFNVLGFNSSRVFTHNICAFNDIEKAFIEADEKYWGGGD